jgi:hypothetical protein
MICKLVYLGTPKISLGLRRLGVCPTPLYPYTGCHCLKGFSNFTAVHYITEDRIFGYACTFADINDRNRQIEPKGGYPYFSEDVTR